MDGLIKRPVLFVFFLIEMLSGHMDFAQQPCIIYGIVKDSAGQSLSNAVITLKNGRDDKIAAYALSKNDGAFILKIMPDSMTKTFTIAVEYSSYQAQIKSFQQHIENCTEDTLLFILIPAVKQLKEVVIKAAPIPFSIKGDTIEFNARNYKTPDTKKLQDLLANMQGFQVSADGRISFNGKEVEKILIEGEDLAEKNYKLLSRNLNAGWVQKVQVLNNYNDDRIMKSVYQSDKIGVNLIMEEAVKNKLSGNLTGGFGTKNRHLVENNLILLTKKVKWLSLLNYNNTGDLSNADLHYYFNQDLPDIAAINNSQLPGLILQTGKIYPPDLANAYIRNNNSFSGAAIASWRAGHGLTMKMMVAYEKEKLENNGDVFQQTYLPDGQQWYMLQKVNAVVKNKGIGGVFSLSHDNKKNNTGFLSVEASGRRNQDNFGNLVKGIVSDDAEEKITNEIQRFSLKGYESWSIDTGKVFSMHYHFRNTKTDQDFYAATDRYQDFFLLDSSFKHFYQMLNRNVLYGDVDAGLHIRRKKTDYSLIWRTEQMHSDWNAGSKAQNSSGGSMRRHSDPFSILKHSGNSISARYHSYLTKRSTLSSMGTLGYQAFNVQTDVGKLRKSLPLINAVVSFRHRIRPTQFFNLEYQIKSSKPQDDLFFPDSLLSGNASILNPAKTIFAPFYQTISIQLFYSNLYKSTSMMLTGSFTGTKNEYSNVAHFYPSYTWFNYLPFSGNKQINLLANVEKYLSGIRMKFVLQPSLIQLNTQMEINEVQTENSLFNARMQGKMISGFKGMFNLEVSGTMLYTRNRTRPLKGESIQQSFRQWLAYTKIKLAPAEKIYFAILYQYNRFTSSSLFQSMDIFGNFTCTKDLSFSLSLHNLFNSGAIVQRQFSANSFGEQRFELVGRYLMIKMSWEF